MTEPAFSTFLERSFDRLRRGAPLAYARVVAVLSLEPVRVRVGQETLEVHASDGHLRIGVTSDRALARLVTTRAALRRLVEGETTLVAAVLDESFHLQGSVEQLLRLHDALDAYLHGAVRAPGMDALLAKFLGETPPQPASRSTRGQPRRDREGAEP